jgi:hypothetical protein
LGTGTTHTYEANFDDWIISKMTAPPEFVGPGRVIALAPIADGTHNAGVNTMEDNAGTDIGATAAWSIIDDVPMSEITTYIQQSTIGAGNYAEVAFADAPTTEMGTINAISAILAYSASSATNTNLAETRIRRGDGTPTDVLGLGAAGTGANGAQTTAVGTGWDMSDTGPIYKAALVPLSANGTDYIGWTIPLLNALLLRVGFGTDVTPVPRWGNIILEVDIATPLANKLIVQQAIKRTSW